MKFKYRSIVYSSLMAIAIVLPTITLTSCSTVSIANRALTIKSNLVPDLVPPDLGPKDLSYNLYSTYLPTEFRFWDDGKSGQHIYGDMIKKEPGKDSRGAPYPWPANTPENKSWVEYSNIKYSYADNSMTLYDYGLYNQYISTLICASIGYQMASNISLMLNFERLHPEIWGTHYTTSYPDYKEFNYALANTLSVGATQVYFAMDNISFTYNMKSLLPTNSSTDFTTNILQSPGINNNLSETIPKSQWDAMTTAQICKNGGLIPYYKEQPLSNGQVQYVVEKDDKTGAWAYKPYPVVISDIEITYSYYNPTIFGNSDPNALDIKDLSVIETAVKNSGNAWSEIGETTSTPPSTLEWTVTTTAAKGTLPPVSSSDPRIQSTFYPGDVVIMLQYADDPATIVLDNPDTPRNEYDHSNAKQLLTGAPKTSTENTANWFFLEFIDYYDQTDVDNNKISFNQNAPYPFELGTTDWLSSLTKMQPFFEYIVDFGSYNKDSQFLPNQQFNRLLPVVPKNKHIEHID